MPLIKHHVNQMRIQSTSARKRIHFLFFCLMMVLQLIWVKTTVTETKGGPLEQVQEILRIA